MTWLGSESSLYNAKLLQSATATKIFVSLKTAMAWLDLESSAPANTVEEDAKYKLKLLQPPWLD